MKHLKLLPLLIAAAFCMPRAQAADLAGQGEPSSYAIALICVALVVSAIASQRRPDSFKKDN